MSRLISTLSRYSRVAQGVLGKSAVRASAGSARQRTRRYLEPPAPPSSAHGNPFTSRDLCPLLIPHKPRVCTIRVRANAPFFMEPNRPKAGRAAARTPGSDDLVPTTWNAVPPCFLAGSGARTRIRSEQRHGPLDLLEMAAHWQTATPSLPGVALAPRPPPLPGAAGRPHGADWDGRHQQRDVSRPQRRPDGQRHAQSGWEVLGPANNVVGGITRTVSTCRTSPWPPR